MRKVRVPVVCLMAMAAGSLLQAAGSVPVSYNAATDLTVRPKPPLPPMGPAGAIIHDPTYGSRILRVTDTNTEPNAPGTVFLTPAGAFVHNWNADSTMFWVYGPGGIVPFKFDAASMRVSRVPKPGDPSGGLTLPINGPFSYRRPNILYGNKGLQIVEYDFNTEKYTTVFDGNKAVPGVAQGSYSPTVSDDDTKLCMPFGGIQDRYQYVAVLDRNTGRYSVLDTKNSSVDGKPTMQLGFGMHSAYIDRSGRYVVMGKGEGNPGKSQWAVWDVQTGVVAEILAHWSGHDASGFGVRVNEAGYCGGNPSFYEQIQYAIRSLDPAQINDTKYLIPEDQLPTPHLPVTGGHFSWNNAQPNNLVPVVGSHYREVGTAGQPWRAWDDEIIAVATDGSSKVWRFAHHRSSYDGNFWNSPRGNVSQDGRWYIFTSNWEKTLGKTPGGGSARQDVFIVELSAGATVPDHAPAQAPAPAQASAPAPVAKSNAPAPANAQGPAPAPVPVPAPSGNLLADPGFEGGGAAWTGSNQAGQSITAGQVHSGKVALALDASKGDRAAYQDVRVFDGVMYDVSGWAITKGSGWGTGLQISWLDGSGRTIHTEPVDTLSKTTAWTLLNKRMFPPPGATTARIRVYGVAACGTTWFDDLAVRPVTQ